jgi:hypothetical protein
MSYHDAMVFVEDAREVMDPENRRWVEDGKTISDFQGDPLWPARCSCGYEFLATDHWQLFGSHIYFRPDTGEEFTLRDAPVGAMWDAAWFHDVPAWCGEDGKALMCRLPGNHDWHIDGPCSNCTRPNEPHKCWIRHGVPPHLTVDKNGDTCAAGAGSIALPNWHGFLRNGELVT